MGFFKGLARAPRGVGRILRGKFKEGIADLGGGLRSVSQIAAPFAPGLSAIGTATGALMDKVDDPGGLRKTKLFKEVAAPAAMTYAGGKVAGHLMNRGAGAASETALPSVQRGLADSAGIASSFPAAPASGGMSALNIGGGLAESTRAPSERLAADVMAKHKVPAPRLSAGGYLKKIGGYFGDEESGAGRLLAASKLAETGLGAYGAYQEGAYLDREREKEEEANERLRQYFAESGLGEKLMQRMRRFQ